MKSFQSDLSVVQLPVYVDLTLCDVARQVRDGMCNIWRSQHETCLVRRVESAG